MTTVAAENNVISIESMVDPEENELAYLGSDAHLTDMGNAARLSFLHGDKFRWCPALGWLFFDGKRWKATDDVLIMEYARDVPQGLLEEAAAEKMHAGRRKALAEWALESEKRSSLSNMCALLRSEPGIRVPQEQLDENPMVLNLQNGTLDLRTGSLDKYSPGDLLTRVANASFREGAECPQWGKVYSRSNGRRR